MLDSDQTLLCVEKKSLENKRDIEMLLGALTSHHGPLIRVAKYVYQYFVLYINEEKKSAKTVLDMAVCKMAHVDKIEKLLLELGYYGKGVFAYQINFCERKELEGKSQCLKMIIDDLTGEMASIYEYEKKLKAVKSERIKALIESFIKDEREHIKTFENALRELPGQNK